jgi:hypothetical protein
VVAELLDAVGEGDIGEDHRQALHRPVDAPLGGGGPDRLGRGLAVGEPLDRFPMVVVERLDQGGELLVRRRADRPVEQPQ